MGGVDRLHRLARTALVASTGRVGLLRRPRPRRCTSARCLALEGAPIGIRVNVVNPDAVIRGSRIWSGTWRSERAAANKIDEDGRRGALPPALHAEAQRAARGRRRGRLFLRLRCARQVDRQHPQRRRRQPRRRSRDERRCGQMPEERTPMPPSSTTTPRRATLDDDYAHLGAPARPPRHRHRGAGRQGDGLRASPCPPGASAPAARGSRASPAPASRATCTRSSRTARVVHQLGRATPAVSLHFPVGQASDCGGAAPGSRGACGLRLRRGELQHLPGPARPARISYKFGSLTPHRRRGARSRRSSTTSSASRSAAQLGSTR